MTNNASIPGTVHIRALLDAALEAPDGIRVLAIQPGKATHLRSQIHSLRSGERKKTARAWPEGDPKHGTSGYDSLLTEICERPDGLVDLRIIKSSALASDLQVVDDKSGEVINLAELL